MIYLIIGDVPYLKDQALARLKNKFKDREVMSFFGPECKAKQILAECTNLSLLGDSPGVIVRAADRLAKAEQTVLQAELKRLPEDCCLILLADKIDKRLKFWQILSKQAEVISAEAPPAKERRSWLQQDLQGRGLQLAPDAFQTLYELILADFNQSILILEKLALFLGNEKQVSRDTLESCLSGGTPVKIFEWVEAVGAGRWKQAFALLQKLWANQEAPLALLALLLRHFRILLRAVEHSALWGRSGELARVLGVPPFAVDKYVQQARRYDRETLISCWELLFETDRNLKSSPIKKELELEALLWKLRQRIKARV